MTVIEKNKIRQVSEKKLSVENEGKCHVLVPYDIGFSGHWKAKPVEISASKLFGPATLRKEKVIIYPCDRNSCAIQCPCFICRKKLTFWRNKKRMFKDHVLHHKALHLDCIFCKNLFEVIPSYNYSVHLNRVSRGEPRYVEAFRFWHEFDVAESSEETQLRCKVCRLRFTRYEDKLRHQDSVHLKQSLTCTQCKATFTRKDSLKKHKDELHGQDEYFECDICNVQFMNISSFKRHTKAIRDSDGNAVNKCDECPGEFCTAKTLKAHKKVTHKFQRTDCSESFSKNSSLIIDTLKVTKLNAIFATFLFVIAKHWWHTLQQSIK